MRGKISVRREKPKFTGRPRPSYGQIQTGFSAGEVAALRGNFRRWQPGARELLGKRGPTKTEKSEA